MSIWQTPNWKNLLLKSNQAKDVFEIDNIFIEKRSIGLWQYWLFILWFEEKQKINKQQLVKLCKKEKCLFIQIESFSLKGQSGILLNELGIKEWYYKKFITPYTAIIDLSKTIENILSQMKPKWRYNINLATKKWIEVFSVEKNDNNIKIFYDLMLETTSRDNFNWNKFSYYKDFLNIIPNSELIFAKLWEKILRAWIFVFDKEISIYYYWASTSNKEYRNLMAPYAMQWYAIKKAKDFGSKFYDFLWISTPWEKKSPLIWVTDFKLKFTSDTIKISDSYIFINNKFIYFIFVLIKKIKLNIKL